MYSADDVVKIINALNEVSYIKKLIAQLPAIVGKIFTAENIKAAASGIVEGAVKGAIKSKQED